MYLRCVEILSALIGFLQIFKVVPKSGQTPCTIVHGHWPNFIKNGKERILHFYTFSDAYTCTYVV